MSQTILQPEICQPAIGDRWMVTIFDNPFTSQEAVVTVLIEATGCTADEAYIEMWEAEAYGQAPVYFASKSECDSVAEIISSVGVRTSVSPEWNE